MKPPWIVDANPGDIVFACEYKNNEPVWRRGKLVGPGQKDYHYLVNFGGDGEDEVKQYHQHELRAVRWCEWCCQSPRARDVTEKRGDVVVAA